MKNPFLLDKEAWAYQILETLLYMNNLYYLYCTFILFSGLDYCRRAHWIKILGAMITPFKEEYEIWF